MKKTFFVSILLGILIVPTIVSAAWWNPATWFNNWRFFKKEDQVETLEKKIKELEQKINTTNEPVSVGEEKSSNKLPVETNKNTTEITKKINQVDDSPKQNLKAKNDLYEGVEVLMCNGQSFYNVCSLKESFTCPETGKAFCDTVTSQTSSYDQALKKVENQQKVKNSEMKNSPECIAATEEYNSLKSKADDFYQKYSANTSAPEAREYLAQSADYSVKATTALTKKNNTCEGFSGYSPTKTYNTNCYYLGETLRCTTY